MATAVANKSVSDRATRKTFTQIDRVRRALDHASRVIENTKGLKSNSKHSRKIFSKVERAKKDIDRAQKELDQIEPLRWTDDSGKKITS